MVKIQAWGSSYQFLAKCQRTEKAVISIHTNKEIVLYDKLISDEDVKNEIGITGTRRTPDFKKFAGVWSSECESSNNVYFKTSKHLESYYNILGDRVKYRDSVVLNTSILQEVRTALSAENRTITSIPANLLMVLDNNVDTPLRAPLPPLSHFPHQQGRTRKILPRIHHSTPPKNNLVLGMSKRALYLFSIPRDHKKKKTYKSMCHLSSQ